MSDIRESGPPPSQTRCLRALMGYAVALGVLGAVAALLFMGVIGFGNNWYTDPNPGWFGSQWWWIAITAAAATGSGIRARTEIIHDG